MVQDFVGAELLTGYEDLDSSETYENHGEGLKNEGPTGFEAIDQNM